MVQKYMEFEKNCDSGLFLVVGLRPGEPARAPGLLYSTRSIKALIGSKHIAHVLHPSHRGSPEQANVSADAHRIRTYGADRNGGGGAVGTRASRFRLKAGECFVCVERPDPGLWGGAMGSLYKVYGGSVSALSVVDATLTAIFPSWQ